MDMIRDMDLIRRIVLAVRDHEARPSASEVQALISDGEDGSVEDGVFGYHIEMLSQSAMMTGIDTGPRKDRYGRASLALTWTGHDFADNILSDEVWSSARKTLDDAKLAAASFEVWSQMVTTKLIERCAAAQDR